MKELKFSNYQILVPDGFNYRPLTSEDTSNIESSIWQNDGITYDIKIESISKDYLFVFAHYGNPAPCPDSIFDEKLNKYVENSRNINQIEMKYQLFALYNFNECILYCSNNKKKCTIEKFLQQEINSRLTIKTIFIDIEEFQRRIKKIKSLKFTSLDNMFKDTNLLSNAFKDYTGYNTDIDFTIEIKSKTPNLLNNSNVIKKIKEALTNQHISDLTIIGTDESDFEQIFNQCTFNKMISIFEQEDENGFLKPEKVLQKLLERVSNV